MHIFKNTQLQLPPLALARDRAVVGHHHRRRRHARDQGHSEGRRVRRRHGRDRAVRSGRRRCEQVREALDQQLPGRRPEHRRADVRRPGGATGDDSRAAASAPSRARRSAAEAQQVEDALDKANLGTFKRQGAEIVGPTVGRELTSKGILGDRAVARRHPRLPRVPVPVQLRRRRRRRDDPRPARSRSRSWPSSATTCRSTSSPRF